MSIHKELTKELENGRAGKPAPDKEVSNDQLGQHYPRQSPEQNPRTSTPVTSPLGEPLSINQVAAMLGCSAWTVRNSLVPKGLPHFRSGPTSRLTFFSRQVVAWVQRKQKGGFKL